MQSKNTQHKHKTACCISLLSLATTYFAEEPFSVASLVNFYCLASSVVSTGKSLNRLHLVQSIFSNILDKSFISVLEPIQCFNEFGRVYNVSNLARTHKLHEIFANYVLVLFLSNMLFCFNNEIIIILRSDLSRCKYNHQFLINIHVLCDAVVLRISIKFFSLCVEGALVSHEMMK